MGKKSAALIVLVLCVAACSDFRLHVKKGNVFGGKKTVIIGPFEVRNINYDPFLESQFRDALNFEFFTRGVHTVLLTNGELETLSGRSFRRICEEKNADFIITGVISFIEEGYLSERSSSSSVLFKIIRNDGTAAGQGYYRTDKLISSDLVMREAVSEFADAVLDETGYKESP